MEKANFGAGCFWGVEAAFRKLEGVVDTRVGYEGGRTQDPSYFGVCTGLTGHSETVEVDFDPEKISYEELLEVFWKTHDPSRHNKSQYKSVIFYRSEEQKEIAEKSKKKKEKETKETIVTEIVPHTVFHMAEEYHQHYMEKRGY